VSYCGQMDLGEPDRLLAAKIIGTALHYSRWRELSADEESAAVTAIFDVAPGRADLLAYAAGILVGASEGELDEPRKRQAADLLLKAGADPEAIPRWIEVGRYRAQSARQVPHPGGGFRRPDGSGRPRRDHFGLMA
jgi:Zn-dependent protease with chaperone function